VTDIPTGLIFVDPTEVQTTYRIALAGEPGDGKTIAAATAPGPLLVLNADRPSAWEVARRRNPGKDIRETRYVDHSSLDEVFRYLNPLGDGGDIRTLVIDPWSNIYDQLCAAAPKKLDTRDGEMKPDYEMVNAKLLGFLTALRRFDVHLVIVTHLKENEGKKGDGKTYARFGGMGLIRKAMAEMDVIALVQRTTPEDGEPVWFAQVQPTDVWAGKDGTDALGPRRVADLSRWIELARAANVVPAVDADLPWAASSAQPGADPIAGVEAGAAQADRPEVEPSAAAPQRDSDRNEAGYATGTDAPAAEPASDAEAQAALARATVAEREPLNALDWRLLDRLMAGDTAQAAADNLGGTVARVREHVGLIKVKLGVRTMPAVLELARRLPRGEVTQ
jgi:DNA-binding CsgD family transcriptional regulator